MPQPQQRTPVQFGYQEVRSLQTVNQHLSGLGINRIDAQTHERFLQQPMDDLKTFCSAVRQASHNVNAKQHVVNAIAAYLPAEPAQAANTADDGFPHDDGQQFEAQPTQNHGASKVTNLNEARATRAPQQNAPTQSGGQTSQSEQPTNRINEHVYAGKGALCFEPSMTRREIPTITMDAAKAVGDKVYDWNSKVTIQFTRDELPAVTALFLGLLPSIKFANHGPENNKSFEMHNQDGKIFVKVFAPETMIPVPVAPADVSYVASLLMRQILKGQPHLRDPSGIINWLRHTYVRLAAKTQ